MRLKFTMSALALVLLASAPLASAQSASKDAKTVYETAKSTGSHNTLVAAIDAAGLKDAANGTDMITVFAPTDDAFAALPDGTVEALLANPEKLAAILTHHVVAGKAMAADVLGAESHMSVFGQALAVDADVPSIGGAKITATDVACSNGVIHVIDSVIVPKTLVEIGAENEDFSTLVAAVEAAGLVETLSGDGPFTIFAPTNDAFAKIPEATLAELLEPENKDKLTSILTYHVVPGAVMASDVTTLASATTVEGSDIDISVKTDGGETTVMVDEATVVATDIKALNGVIHVIDTVIMP